MVQRRDLLLAGGNPWYTALLYGIGKRTRDTITAAQERAAATFEGRGRSDDPELGRILLGTTQTRLYRDIDRHLTVP